MNYYNEFDPFAARWLRELIKEGLIPDGEVDERSIIDVDGKDLKGFTQCHFFAGIGGWSYALQLAGWGSARPVWTGSPPCQPFSVAGAGKAQDDERHLWPHFFNLIRECKPPTVFGEQVASAIRTEWFDDLQTDMENQGYATAMAVLPACSVGAPHKRERLFFVADSVTHRRQQSMQPLQGEPSERSRGDSLNSRSLGNTNSQGSQGHGEPGELHLRQPNGESQDFDDIDPSISDSTLAQSDNIGSVQQSIGGRVQEDRAQSNGQSTQGCGSPWSEVELVYCRDEKSRQVPAEPSLFPVANGVPNRVGLLRGAGNAIVPQVAAEIIKAYMEY